MSRNWRIRRIVGVAGAAGLAIAAILIAAAAFGPGRIPGTTTQERIASICRLADQRPRRAGDLLAEAAADDPDGSVRQAALVALARFPERGSRSAVEACVGDPSPVIRATAAATLGVYQDEAAADRLGAVAGADPDVQARLGAVTGLGRNKTPQSLMWLLETAEKDPNAQVQFMAIKELHRRLGMKYIGDEPAKVANWPRQAGFVVEYLKEYPQIQEAYAKTGRALVARPEYRPIGYVEPKEGGRPWEEIPPQP
jgi:hypothetical protein